MVSREVRQILRLQVLLSLLAVLVTAVVTRFNVAFVGSVLVGGAGVIFPALIYAKIAYSKRHVPPVELMRAHFKAEAVKFMLTVFIYMGLMQAFKNISVPALLIGYFVAVSGYWFGLLIRN